MKIEKEELLSIIPHKNRMMLLSRVVDFNAENKSIEAEYEIKEDCLFYDSALSGVPAWTGFEFIAQSVSAFIGIRDLGKKTHKMGYILSVSQMRIGLPFFKTGSIITIKSREAGGMDPVYVFEGEIYLYGEKVVEGKITVLDVYDEQTQLIKKESETID
jgi:predicted hotdog family 3-hydroxylacyl-ACP dehydratase